MKYYRLAELCREIVDCPHSTPEWKTEGIRVVRNFNLKDGNLDFTDGYFVDEETYKSRTRRAVPEPGDIIISREAPMGAVGIVPEGLKCCLGQRLVLLKVNREKCNPSYLLFSLMSEFVQIQMKRAGGTGSIVSNLCIPDLKDLLIPVMEKGQDEAARLLEAMNQKYMLHARISRHLYDMAYTIYMHLFFEKTPNGKVGDILVENPKSVIRVGEAKEAEGAYPFFTSGDAILRWSEPLVDGRNCFLNTGGNGDIKFYVGDAAYSTDTWCITGKDNLSDYLYLFLESIRPELDKKFFQGTGLKHLQKPLLRERPVYIPKEGELKAFNLRVQPCLDMISHKARASAGLVSLRDWLLPVLMNGQVRV